MWLGFPLLLFMQYDGQGFFEIFLTQKASERVRNDQTANLTHFIMESEPHGYVDQCVACGTK